MAHQQKLYVLYKNCLNISFSIAQQFQLNYGEPMPCEQLVSYLCDIKQAYTQYGGKRPFGVSILYMGWDKHYGYQLYQSDPSGNYGGWKATCIGNNSGAAVSILKQELSEDPITLTAAEDLAVKVLSKSLDMTKLTSEKGANFFCFHRFHKTQFRANPILYMIF